LGYLEEQLAGYDEKKVKEIINEVIWHEVGHHLGFGEKEIRVLEIKRRNYNIGVG
jgi:predicted Zn-dependent protease with MMP-like domain